MYETVEEIVKNSKDLFLASKEPRGESQGAFYQTKAESCIVVKQNRDEHRNKQQKQQQK